MAGGTLKSLLVRLGADSSALNTGLKQAEKRTSQTSKKFEGLVGASKRADAALALQAQKAQALAERHQKLTDTLKRVSVALTVVAVAGTAFLVGATKLAARVETLDIVVQQLGRTAGYTVPQLKEFEQGIKSQGITLQKTRNAMAMMMQSQIDLAYGTRLAALAQNTAVIANVDSSEAFQRLTYVVQTGNVLMGRRMGLNLDFMKSQKALAATLGKTKDQLTTQEVIQARLNEVLRVGSTVTGVYEAAMETAGKKALSLNRHIEETRRILGETYVNVFGMVIDATTNLLKGFQNLSAGQQSMIAVVIGATTAFTGLAGAGLMVTIMLPPLIAGLNTLGIASAGALGPIGLIVGILAGLVTALVASKVALVASHKAFNEIEKQAMSTEASYKDYLRVTREAAEAEGLTLKTKDELIAMWEAHNEMVRASHNPRLRAIDIEKELARVEAGSTNIVLLATEAMREHARVSEYSQGRLKDLSITQEVLAQSTRNLTGANEGYSSSLMGVVSSLSAVTEAQFATAILKELGEQFEEDIIGADTYANAVRSLLGEFTDLSSFEIERKIDFAKFGKELATLDPAIESMMARVPKFAEAFIAPGSLDQMLAFAGGTMPEFTREGIRGMAPEFAEAAPGAMLPSIDWDQLQLEATITMEKTEEVEKTITIMDHAVVTIERPMDEQDLKYLLERFVH